MEGHWNGYRHVDPNHSGLDIMYKLTRGVAVAGKDGAAVAELMAVYQLQRAVVVRHADNTQYRAKNLFAPDSHFRRHVVEQRSANVVTLFETGNSQLAPVNHQRRPFADAFINISQHFFLMRL